MTQLMLLNLGWNDMGSEGVPVAAEVWALQHLAQLQIVELSNVDLSKKHFPLVLEGGLTEVYLATLQFWWQQEEQGQKLCWELQVLMLGDGTVGNSTLVDLCERAN